MGKRNELLKLQRYVCKLCFLLPPRCDVIWSFLAAEYDINDCVEAVEDFLIRQVVDGGEGGELDENSLLNVDHLFAIFMRRFNKAYHMQEEHDYRFSVFRANLGRARRHKELDHSAVHGVTQFSDLTLREFRLQFLGVNMRLRISSNAHKASILDWNELGE